MTPLRSVLIGDTDHYFSPYIFGVAQACSMLGIWHSQVSIRLPAVDIARRVADVQPHLIWTHMLLWPPGGTKTAQLAEICRAQKKQGAYVFIHDGDAKERVRFAEDISDFVTLALCNHRFDRSPWKVPTLHWPYAAFVQNSLADMHEEFACDVAFAGTISSGPTYNQRSALVDAVKAKGVNLKVFDGKGGGNTMLQTPAMAASATSVLGFGRPDMKGWVDTRVFQYPGAGSILLHDDVQGYLEPWAHYAPYTSGNADSIIEAVERIKMMSPAEQQLFRLRAMAYTQEKHSWKARVKEAIQCVST